jgi:alanine dehydrogenase
MEIGIPKEIKVKEGRVGLIPAAAAELVNAGHQVFLQSNAGIGSGYSNSDYEQIGVRIAPDAQQLYEQSQLIIKVKEPIEGDLAHLREQHTIFCYLHLAANPDLTKALQEIGLCAVGFETVADGDRLPLLAPMSDIAGQLSIHIGSQLLHHYTGGKGVMLGGLAGTKRGKVVILGAGVAGRAAARVAASLGAEVCVFARRREQQDQMRMLGPNVTALYPFQSEIGKALLETDLLVGAVLVPGAKAPCIVSKTMVRQMQSGSVIVDIAVDQGGCIESIYPTNYEKPTYLWEGVIHFAVTNMPGAVPRTSSQALSASILPYALTMAQKDWQKDANLNAATNVKKGKIVLSTLK